MNFEGKTLPIWPVWHQEQERFYSIINFIVGTIIASKASDGICSGGLALA